MKPLLTITLAASTMLIIAGCTTSPSTAQKPERGRDGTIAYLVEIESSEPGARVEANNDVVGKTPMTLKIFGDKDGTFHNFGSYDYRITVFPTGAGQQPQTKVFRTGGWFTPEDKIPTKLFFDFGSAPGTPPPGAK
jgi:hypothetical protein